MSSGFRSASRFCTTVPPRGSCPATVLLKPVNELLSTGVPSTTKIGWFESSSVLKPRMFTNAPPPASPVDEVTHTPGALPASADTTFSSWLSMISSASTVLTV